MSLFTRTASTDTSTGNGSDSFTAHWAPSTVPATDPLGRARTVASSLGTAVESVVAGRRDVVDTAVACLLSRGHLLVEDIPGVGKTLLAQALSAAIGGSFRRIQGTVDLLPGDVTGTLVPDRDPAGGDLRSGVVHMRFRPGPVFANVVVFDELNRTAPRTQSALLEVAEESTVTVDGTSHPLPRPFFLVATQNPIDIAGTYRLGEGAADRFAAVVSPGRALRDDEVAVLTGRRGRHQLDGLRPVVTLAELEAAQEAVATVAVSDAVAGYVVALLDATRSHPQCRLGASTRGGLALVGLARARALMGGRAYVVPDDVQTMAVAALAHRVVPTDGDGSTTAGRALVEQCLAQVRPPTV